MSTPPPRWQLVPRVSPPAWFVQAVRTYVKDTSGHFAAELLWQRGIQTEAALAQFVDAQCYPVTDPLAFGVEMQWAIARLQQAMTQQETVAIWGDFDADGVTATAVLWEGLRPFFPEPGQLHYFIPNRLRESHGLSRSGLQDLADRGCRLIITCDTGSTNQEEIAYAHTLGLEVIVTDHHTLPAQRPPVVAIVNPRSLSPEHPLAHLSGVAVAYKLLEALYQAMPDRDTQPLADLLDLVAIGLIADLVALKGDCRYLAQRGIACLQTLNQTPDRRPGVHRLLELCRRTGDRPTDIAFGLGPRINAVSRIQGDAHCCVELLTSRDHDRSRFLAEQAELLNTRRKALQKDILNQAIAQLTALDLSTTHVIVLAEVGWPVGILGLVAGQLAQQTGRPTILLSLDPPVIGSEDETADLNLQWPSANSQDGRVYPAERLPDRQWAQPTPTPCNGRLARGSARSVNHIDLYQLVKGQEHLLTSFGGHPFAAGLSLSVDNLPLFTEAINRQLRQQTVTQLGPIISVDLTVTVADLGRELFQELKLLEPCGMGNPVPRLLLHNVWFEQVRKAYIKDPTGQKLRYLKTEFLIRDASTAKGFPGIWWEHAAEELPTDRCDAIVELDFNAAQKDYHIRLIDVQVAPVVDTPAPMAAIARSIPNMGDFDRGFSPDFGQDWDWLLDWRHGVPESHTGITDPLMITTYPTHWRDLVPWLEQALAMERPLAIAFPPPVAADPIALWEQLLGMAKYLSRTQQPIGLADWAKALAIQPAVLDAGLAALATLGFQLEAQLEAQPPRSSVLRWSALDRQPEAMIRAAIDRFFTVFQENQFRQRYFYQVPWSTLRAMLIQMLHSVRDPVPPSPG